MGLSHEYTAWTRKYADLAQKLGIRPSAETLHALKDIVIKNFQKMDVEYKALTLLSRDAFPEAQLEFVKGLSS